MKITTSKIIYENTEDGFVIFLARLGKDFETYRQYIRDDGCICLKGYISAFYEKMGLEVEGSFEKDAYEGGDGYTFNITSFRPCFDCKADLVKFLSSKNFPYINRKIGEQIADEYGTSIFDSPLDYRFHDFLLTTKVRKDKIFPIYNKLVYLSNYYYLKGFHGESVS